MVAVVAVVAVVAAAAAAAAAAVLPIFADVFLSVVVVVVFGFRPGKAAAAPTARCLVVAMVVAVYVNSSSFVPAPIVESSACSPESVFSAESISIYGNAA